MDTVHRHILDHQSTALVLVDASFRVVYLNQAAESLLATSDDRCRREPLSHILRNGETFVAELKRALAEQQSYTKREAALFAPLSDAHFTADLTVTPLPRGDLSGLILELHPLDRLLRINREATQVQVQKTTRQLVRGLAHEVKNPLGGIRGAAQLLSRELDDASLRDYTSIIIDEADRLRNLVDRMLGPNQLPRKEPTNIHALLERVRALLEAEVPGRVRFERDYDPSIPDVYCDPEQIMQALLNVVRNGVQALEDTEGARIALRTRTLRRYTIGPTCHRLVARIDVLDNGPGIPPEILERLFYPMISGRADGTGLGLSIAHAIVSQHGGLIETESEPGHTRFTLLMPIEASRPEASHEK